MNIFSWLILLTVGNMTFYFLLAFRGRTKCFGWKEAASLHSGWLGTLNSSERIWPPPFSTGVSRHEEPPTEEQREISLSQFISTLFEGVGRLLPGDIGGLLMCRPGSSQLRSPVAKRCGIGCLEVNRVSVGTE